MKIKPSMINHWLEKTKTVLLTDDSKLNEKTQEEFSAIIANFSIYTMSHKLQPQEKPPNLLDCYLIVAFFYDSEKFSPLSLTQRQAQRNSWLKGACSIYPNVLGFIESHPQYKTIIQKYPECRAKLLEFQPRQFLKQNILRQIQLLEKSSPLEKQDQKSQISTVSVDEKVSKAKKKKKKKNKTKAIVTVPQESSSLEVLPLIKAEHKEEKVKHPTSASVTITGFEYHRLHSKMPMRPFWDNSSSEVKDSQLVTEVTPVSHTNPCDAANPDFEDMGRGAQHMRAEVNQRVNAMDDAGHTYPGPSGRR